MPAPSKKEDRKTGRQHLYVGKSGQMAAMSEFLLLGYNIAVPEVDVGDDIFIVEDRRGVSSRVQVKTSLPTRSLKRESGKSFQFNVPLKQLETPAFPELFYVLVARMESTWEFVVISREDLYDARDEHKVGSVSDGNLVLNLTFRQSSVTVSKRDFQSFRNNWIRYWPPIEHG